MKSLNLCKLFPISVAIDQTRKRLDLIILVSYITVYLFFANLTWFDLLLKLPVLVGPLSAIHPFSHLLILTSSGHWATVGN